MHILIFPAIAEVTLITVEAYEPPLPEEAVALGGFTLVLMHLGQTIGEIEALVVDGV